MDGEDNSQTMIEKHTMDAHDVGPYIQTVTNIWLAKCLFNKSTNLLDFGEVSGYNHFQQD